MVVDMIDDGDVMGDGAVKTPVEVAGSHDCCTKGGEGGAVMYAHNAEGSALSLTGLVVTNERKKEVEEKRERRVKDGDDGWHVPMSPLLRQSLHDALDAWPFSVILVMCVYEGW